MFKDVVTCIDKIENADTMPHGASSQKFISLNNENYHGG